MSATAPILLTGATGFIGHHVLASLLRRGRRCVAIARGPVDQTETRLSRLLAEVGLDADWLLASERLICVEGDLGARLPRMPDRRATTLIHAAGATHFVPNAEGDPGRTNVAGTRDLLDWANATGIDEVHLLSSAYVCGRAHGPIGEAIGPVAPDFHNAYERSKYEAERLCAAWQGDSTRRLTIYRPSIVVGDFASGRATAFSGFYMLARAMAFLDRALEGADDRARHTVELRIKGRGRGRQNFVPVDYVAAVMARIIEDSNLQGRVHHLTHPCPPTNADLKAWLERDFDLGGGHFVEPDQFPRDDELNEYERTFHDVARPIEPYIADTPTFDRGHTEAAERSNDIRCPHYDAAAIGRLLSYAHSVGWGRRPAECGMRAPIAAYFERFLPPRFARSVVSRVTGLTTSVRFVIEDEGEQAWVCRFEAGQLTGASRSFNGTGEEFGYRISSDTFREAISGRVAPQELFLSGRAEIIGDVEKALKMAAMIHDFTREFPCDDETLVRYGAR